MASKSIVTGIAATALLAGCAIRPVPENVVKINSYEIVRRVRCEMRDAIRAFVIRSVRDADPVLADNLREDTFYRTYDQRRFDERTRIAIEQYGPAIISYVFTFDITEQNNVGARADLGKTFTNGVVRLGLTAGTERKRNSTEVFRINDNFEVLTRKVDNTYCTEQHRKPNYAYPIAGKLDLARIVKTFLDLNQSGNLGDLDPSKSVPTLTDTLEFTTVVHAGANPTLDLAPSDNFDLVAAGVTADASRADIHKVTIVLSLPPPGAHGLTIAEQRIEQELQDAVQRDDTRTIAERLRRGLR